MEDKMKKTVIGILFFIGVFVLLADAPKVVNYQGKLTDPAGVPIESPPATSIVFKLYTASGAPMWTSPEYFVNPVHGLFSVELDFTAGAWAGSYTLASIDAVECALEVIVNSTALTPREHISSTFHALNVADKAISPKKLADGGAINQLFRWNSTSSEWELVSEASIIGTSLQNAYNGGNRIDEMTDPVIIETPLGALFEGLIVTSVNSGYPGLYARNSDGGPAAFFAGNDVDFQANIDFSLIDYAPALIFGPSNEYGIALYSNETVV